nr:uncharacterized protein LOC104644619 [Solanum lycopersicum]
MYPWSILGDFNVITSTSEKLGGKDYNINKSLEFISIIEACGLVDMGYYGQDYTWCNHRRDGARIWKRLDRGMTNDKWIETMPHSSITHLPSVGSDHCPLFIEICDIQSNTIKYFKFLNLSTENDSFYKTVENCWKRDVIGNPMWNFHTKLRRLTKTLRGWSKQEYGDVFEKVKLYEELVKKAKNDMISNHSIENGEKLNAFNAKYIKYLKLEYKIIQQKTQLHWLQEGDANTKYFHAVIRGKRNRMAIHKLMDDSGNWIEGEEDIAKKACDYYEEIFTGKNEKITEDILQCINPMITQEQNDGLDRLPDMDELRRIIMSMNPHSAPGPDGFGGKFYQVCFDIIKEDLLAAVNYFYIGNGFVKGRSIAENISLAQEIIHGIKKPKEGSNVVIKLDMVKAYDRVSWTYTCLVLRKMGFIEVFIDRVWRIMSNNWYSIVINGKRHDFFHSKRGLKQGDPLSPALFILGAEVLSRHLNLLYQNNQYKGLQMERKGPKINHLSFADDIIIFASTDSNSLHLIMKTIEVYEDVSDQKVNKEKSFFMVSSNTGHDIIEEIKMAIGFNRKNSPINYLGCPLYIGGQRIIYYSEVVEKWWDFRTKKCLWSQFLKAKYCQSANPVAKNFWWDNWLDTETIASQSDQISSLNNSVVADFIKDGKWNERLIRQQVTPLMIPKILQTNFKYTAGKEDTAIWTPSETGKFTIATAWECIRKKRNFDIINTIIWHKQLPFKIAFFIWRALKGKLPTNELLQKFGKAISECYCCYINDKDDINHILINGNFAKHIWKTHAATLGIVPVNTTLRAQLLKWKDQQSNNELQKLLIQILPNLICWHLWKNKCAVKYGKKSSNIYRVQHGIFKDVMQVIKLVFPSIPWQSSWSKLINIVEHCKQQYNIVLVRWNKPVLGTHKLNTHGSAIQNSGKIGGGGILRDHQGKIVYAFSLPFGFGTNNIAEIKAALYGLEWCEKHGYKRVELEVDSELLYNWIKNKIRIPWRYEDLVQQIQHIIRKMEHFQCHHIYREANITADLLSKWSHSLELVQHIYTTRQLEGAIKGNYLLEKMNTQNFRRRKLKRIKHPP